ncbi:MAG: hypothetical protein ACQER7_13660 [Bacteroidota bacterium]
MKKTWYVLFVIGVGLALVSSAKADEGIFSSVEQQVGAYGLYQDSDDVSDAYGGGLRYAAFTSVAKPRASFLNSVDIGMDIRGEYIVDFDRGHIDTDMFPLKANLLLRTQFTNGFRTYVGGGMGYVWFDEDDGKLDDDVSYSILLGMDQEISSKLSLFLEGEYMWLNVDDDLRGGHVDMDGFGVNAGLNINF